MKRKYYCCGCEKVFEAKKPKGENAIMCIFCNRGNYVIRDDHPFYPKELK